MIGLIGAILPSVMEVAGRFLPEDKEKRAEAEREIEAQLTAHLAAVDLAQIGVNREEARGNWFQSGWRPCTGWVAALSFGWVYLFQPMISFVLAQTGYLVQLPSLDMSQMMPILLGLLGLSGFRTLERSKGVGK
jgi:hypothetical protein|tara:strand:+ start:390 stop:791 length:402 start_codon:yes stop_codon:yes gene_type:complete